MHFGHLGLIVPHAATRRDAIALFLRFINLSYTEGTGVISDDKLSALVAEHFDLRPKGIIQMLDLLRPIYSKTAAYGHFGREEPEFTWERTDKAAALRAAAGL
jgi:S-adenosylmethionine synthetase